MDPRRFALVTGILLLLIGAGGFVPPIVFPVRDPLRIAAGVADPQLLATLAVSPVLNLIRIGLGIWGLYASRDLRGAILYARRLALAIGLLALLGMTPLTDTLFGLAPLYGNSLLFHLILTVAAALVGMLHALPKRAVEDDEDESDDDEDEDYDAPSAAFDRG